MKIVVVDICGTLFRSNTTFDFLHWKFEQDRKYMLFYRIYNSLMWKIFNKICVICIRLDLTRKVGINFLKGYSKDVLREEVERFYESFLSVRKNKQVFLLLDKLKEMEEVELFLASATLDVIGEVVSTHLSIPLLLSTELEYQNNICMGKIQKDTLGTKIKYLSNIVPIWKCFTDDISDLPLIKSASESTIIIYPRTKKKWEKILSSCNVKARIIYIDQN